LTFAAGTFLIATNHQPSGQPLNGFAALVLVGQAFRPAAGFQPAPRAEAQRPAKRPAPQGLISLILAAACLVPLLVQSAISLAGAAVEKRGRGIVFEPVSQVMTTETGGPPYDAALNDGLDLLRRRTGPQDGVLAMDMLNPFNYLLHRPSPRGGM